MKQSSIEWLEKELYEKFEVKGDAILYYEILEKAKEMHKQEVIDAGNSCALKQHIHEDKINNMTLVECMEYNNSITITFGEEYYNETYNIKS